MVSALKAMGLTVDPAPGGGSHYRAVLDGKVYPIPAHNGTKTEIADVYIKGVCRCFSLDYAELKKKL